MNLIVFLSTIITYICINIIFYKINKLNFKNYFVKSIMQIALVLSVFAIFVNNMMYGQVYYPILQSTFTSEVLAFINNLIDTQYQINCITVK